MFIPSIIASFPDCYSIEQFEFWYHTYVTVVQQQYESEVNNEYVIRGNSAILKCSIPSFVADFVTVVSWHDDSEGSYTIDGDKTGDGTILANMKTYYAHSSLPSYVTYDPWI